MSLRRPLFATTLGLVTFATAALADTDPAVEARQSQFKLFAHNLAVLGPMVQGQMEYDAEAAQTAADNLFHLTRHDQGRMWPEGTDTASIDGTRALPDIWEDFDSFVDRFVALQGAAESLQGVAGDGLDALRPAVGQLGAACGACHDDFRAER